MAKVEWSAGIDSVSGALAKPAKTGHHRCSKMLLGTHRIAETTSDVCNRVYIRKQTKRSTPVTVNELENRGRFSAVAAAVRTRSKDLMSISADQAAFLAQKDQPNGKKTMKAYLWAVCGAAWDAEHGA